MSNNLDASVNQRFSSRLGLLLSALGIAVGTGNIWRFPRIAAKTGGEAGAGAFLIAWVCFLFLWSIPLIIAEYTLGRKYRSGVVRTFTRAMGKKFTWMGSFVAFVSTAITFFYTVVVGWCIFYFFHMLIHRLPKDFTDSQLLAWSNKIWNSYQDSLWPVVFHALAVGLGAVVVWKGVRAIERVNKILIPTLLGIVLLCVLRALTLPGAWDGVAYLFTPQWGQLLQPKVWLEALTQNAWDTGAGWGLFLTYAAYMKREHRSVKNAFITGIGNNTVSLLAALMVFGTAFAVLQGSMGKSINEILAIMKEAGPASTGLTFIWMPQLFAKMFLGSPLAILFFLGLTFAGFSSLIAQLELPTRVMVDTGMKRSKSIGLVVAVVYLLGIPSAQSLNILSNQDFVWGVALMISGAFVAIAVIKYGISKLRREELTGEYQDWAASRFWELTLKYFVPMAASILLVWWFYLSVTEYAPTQWFNPFNSYSIMTCVVQWVLMLGLFIIFNKRIARRMLAYK